MTGLLYGGIGGISGPALEICFFPGSQRQSAASYNWSGIFTDAGSLVFCKAGAGRFERYKDKFGCRFRGEVGKRTLHMVCFRNLIWRDFFHDLFGHVMFGLLLSDFLNHSQIIVWLVIWLTFIALSSRSDVSFTVYYLNCGIYLSSWLNPHVSVPLGSEEKSWILRKFFLKN